MINISDEEILRILTKRTKELQIHLTTTECEFFVLLVKLCGQKGYYDNEAKEYSISLSAFSMAKELGVSKNFVSTALLKLQKAAVIERVPEIADTADTDNMKRKKPGKKPYKTIIKMKIFLE